MKREELEKLGLSVEQIDAVMKSNGQAIEAERAKFADYDDIKTQLANANKTIEGFADYDETKAAVEKYKAEAETARNEAVQKIAALELRGKVKDYTSGKKFVNSLTREAIDGKLYDELTKDENKGKSLDDLFNTIIGEDKNILVDETKAEPPVVTNMSGNNGASNDDGVTAAFKKLNPNLDL